MKKFFHIYLSLVLVLVSFLALGTPRAAHADSTITVNSIADNTTAGDGQCTLREAILNANSDGDTTSGDCVAGSGADTIHFDISSAGVHTIQPTSGLPDITDTVTIDGTSQPGWAPNTAVSPNPFNGTMVIEIDGENAALASGFNLVAGSDNSLIKGMIINRFQGHAIGLLGSTHDTVQGNYIGTDSTGMFARSNGTDETTTATTISIGEDNSNSTNLTTGNTTVGGLNPVDRNIISGNYGGAFGIGATDTTIQGNYIGLGADGVKALGNSFGTNVTTGNLTIDYANGLQLGGLQTGAANVISAGSTGGVQPDYSININVQGNYIGTDYTGTINRGNALAGVSFGYASNSPSGSQTSRVENNVIAFNGASGISVTDEVDNLFVHGNTIYDNGESGISITNPNAGVPTSIVNNTVTNNTVAGVAISGATDVQIGGSISSDRNRLSGNGFANVFVVGLSGIDVISDSIIVQGNYIGTDSSGAVDSNIHQGGGVLLQGDPTNVMIGGTESGDGNIIAGNSGFGVGASSFSIPAIPVTDNLVGASILGNKIYSNTTRNDYPSPNGLGIDLYESADTKDSPDGSPNTFTNVGPTANDHTDGSSGSNNYINHPVISSVTQAPNSQTATIGFSYTPNAHLPANQGFRLEFFSNTTADPTGFGEGQTLLASVDVPTVGVSNQAVAVTLPAGQGAVTATATLIDSAATSGFGSTSEFSLSVAASLQTATMLADTGSDASQPWQEGLMLIALSAVGFALRRRLLSVLL